MKKTIWGVCMMILCAVLPSCKEEPLMVEAEKDNTAAPGLFGSYIALEQGTYQVDLSKEGEASVEVTFKTVNPVTAKDVKVTISLLDAEHKEILDMESDDNAISQALGEAGKTFAVKFTAEADKDKVAALKAGAKYVTIAEVNGAVTYTFNGTIAGKTVQGVFEINTAKGNLVGGYHYSAITTENLLAIVGKFNAKDNAISITETFNGNVTGFWNITLQPGALAKFTGNMTNYRGNTYAVDLTEDKSLGVLKVPAQAYEESAAEEAMLAPGEDSMDIDDFLDTYQEILMNLNALSRKAANGDVTMAEEYAQLVATAAEMAEEGNKYLGNMTADQRKRFEDIVKRATEF